MIVVSNTEPLIALAKLDQIVGWADAGSPTINTTNHVGLRSSAQPTQGMHQYFTIITKTMM